MTGNDFLNSFRAAIVPATIASMHNSTDERNDGMQLTLSDGRAILAKRKRIRDCLDQAALDAYVQELLNA